MNPVEARFKYLFWLSRLSLGHHVTVEVFNLDLTSPVPGTQYPGVITHEFIDSERALVRCEFNGSESDLQFLRLSNDSYECGTGPCVGYHPAPLFVVIPQNTKAVHSIWHPWYFWPEGDYEIP